VSSRATRRVRRVGAVAGTDYAWECLSPLARILVSCGHSPRELLSALGEICRTLRVPRRRWDPAQLGSLSDLPHVIALWHSDPRYLGARGQPVALPLRGRDASLAELIQRALPGEDPRAVVQTLVGMGGIRRRAGRYIPTDRHVWLRGELGRVHAANTVLRMLRTVERNLASPANSPIFERAAINPHFPVAKLPAFHRDVSSRASRFLMATDGNMRRREAPTSGGPRTRVGVEVFVFEEPLVSTRQARSNTRVQAQPHVTSRQSRARRRKK
jgi:hypothetical protein